MKKLINSASGYVDEMLEGLVLAHPSLALDGEAKRVVRRTEGMCAGKVGVASGGGSGHLPLFTGYVGKGLLDTCSIGNVFEGPNVASCTDAIRLASAGAGVLLLYGNYGGDRMNFDMASEMLEFDGIETRTVLGTDDIASAPPEEKHKRRGVAGIVYAYKIAGACAEAGADLAEVARIAQKAIDATRTIGVALSACEVPGAGKPTFSIADDEMEMGIGIHGEPGIWRNKLRPADMVAEEMMERLLAEKPAGVRTTSFDPGQQPWRDATRGALHSLSQGCVDPQAARARCRPAACWSLRDLHGDGGRLYQPVLPRRRVGAASVGTRRMSILEGRQMIEAGALKRAAGRAREALVDLEPELNAADAQLGDGDTGGMLSRVVEGFASVDAADGDDLGKVFAAYAQAAAAATGSSLGTLFATAVLSLAKTNRGKTSLAAVEFGPMLAEARDAMLKRGQSQLGDKTAIDAIDAISKATIGQHDWAGVAITAQKASSEALDLFRDLPCKVLLDHSKLETTALYAKVSTQTIHAVAGPLDRPIALMEGKTSPG